MVELLSLIGSSGIGLIGGIASKFVEVKSKKLEYEFKLKDRKLGLDELRLEQTHELDIADKQIERAKAEGEIKIEEKDVEAFTASQTTRFEGVLRFVRPAITFYMLALMTYITIGIWHLVGGLSSFSSEILVDLLFNIVLAIINLTAMCISWWFGSRGGNIKVSK